MPSIAAFIRELLSEDKYSSDFSDKIAERVKVLNIAQLRGIEHVLLQNAKEAKTHLWRSANQMIIDRIKTELAEKEKEHVLEEKLLEEHRVHRRQKAERHRMMKQEEQRVKEMIEAKARADAEKQIREQEMERQNQERFAIMKKVFDGEERRNTWWKRLFLAYVLAVPLVVVMLTIVIPMPLYFIILGVAGVTALTLLAAYRCHLWTIVKPIVVPQEYLDAQVDLLQETLTKQAFSALREKERKFQEQLERDTQEAKKRRRERREKQRLETMLLEQQRLERIAMAKEVIERQRGSQRSGSIMSDQGSLALESIEEQDDLSIKQRRIDEEDEESDLQSDSKRRKDHVIDTVPEVSEDDSSNSETDAEQTGKRVDENQNMNNNNELEAFVDELMAEGRSSISPRVLNTGESKDNNSSNLEDREFDSIPRDKPRVLIKSNQQSVGANSVPIFISEEHSRDELV